MPTRCTKRSERRARTERIVARRVRDYAYDYWRCSWREITPELQGRCRDRHPFDCGDTQCLTCHTGKVLGHPRPRDARLRIAALAELQT